MHQMILTKKDSTENWPRKAKINFKASHLNQKKHNAQFSSSSSREDGASDFEMKSEDNANKVQSKKKSTHKSAHPDGAENLDLKDRLQLIRS